MGGIQVTSQPITIPDVKLLDSTHNAKLLTPSANDSVALRGDKSENETNEWTLKKGIIGGLKGMAKGSALGLLIGAAMVGIFGGFSAAMLGGSIGSIIGPMLPGAVMTAEVFAILGGIKGFMGPI